jgi:hypothetical protein
MTLVDRWMNSATFAPDGVDGGAPSDGGGAGGPSPSAGSGGEAGGGGVSPGSDPAGGAPDPGWNNLGSADDLDHIEVPAQPEPLPEIPPEVPKPVQPPQPQPAPTEPLAAKPPTSEASPAGAQPLTADDPWRIAEGLEANRDEVIAHLATAKFALSEADVRDLDTDVTTAVPKLLARVFLESQVSMQKFLAQAVPGMIKKYNTVSSANDSAEKRFFEAHPSLNATDPQHRSTAVRIATLYRQANPGIPLDQLIAEVGPMVMASLRINGSAAPSAAAPQGRTPKPQAFRPAVNGGGGAPIASEPANEWAGLGQQYD